MKPFKVAVYKPGIKDAPSAHTLVSGLHAFDPAITSVKWWVSKDGYVRRNTTVKGVNQTLYLHRVVMGLNKNDPREVDHKDANPLNNDPKNLQILTRQQHLEKEVRRWQGSRN